MLIRIFIRSPSRNVARFIKKSVLYGIIILLVFLAVTGRLHWLIAIIGSAFAFLPRLLPLLLPLLRYFPMLSRVATHYRSTRASAGATQGQRSRIETHYLRMSLDHDSGNMEGEVLSGQFQGRQLDTMTLDELLELHKECLSHDEQSVSILETYLDRAHGDAWRQDSDEQTTSDQDKTGTHDDMPNEEAFKVLGLEPGASEAEIVDAHRRLMQKIHPDRGGSTFIAAQINKAKDILLEKS